ncbi:GNAT family N-acetyltransferase [Photorhabdus tasmaniensis]
MNQAILPTGFTITNSDKSDNLARARISDLLDHWNVEQTGKADNQPLDFYIRDQDGEVIGGLVGRTSLGVLFINYFFLPVSLRRRGTGSELLRRAEEKARLRGCHIAMLFTMSIQAPDFYLKHGYTIFGEVSCQPTGNARIFMQKKL